MQGRVQGRESREVHVIAVPFDSGLRDARMGRGPGALLDAGLVDRLRAAGASVRTTVVEPPRGVFAAEIATAASLQREVALRVAAARGEGAFPLVLAGNCNTAVGTVGGMMAGGAPPPAVCWFDAHADLNTPETTTSGFLDGMAVAMLTGHCWRTLTHAVPGFHPVPPSRVMLVGTRDVDPLEQEIVSATRIEVLPADELLDDRLPSALDRLCAQAGEAYVHIDLDVLDPSEGRANGYAVDHGLSVAALRGALAQIRARLPVTAAAFTAYDPECDPPRRIAAAAAALATVLAGPDDSEEG